MIKIQQQKLLGSNHVTHSIVVDGEVIHSQLSPYSEAEVEAHLATHLRGPLAARPTPAFVPGGKAMVIKRGRKKTSPQEWNRQRQIEEDE